MVSSIIPGTAGANALGVDSRYSRTQTPAAKREETAANSDRVDLSAGALGQARDSVKSGLSQIHQALALGHDAQSMLVQVQALVRNGGSQADLDALLSNYAKRVDSALSQGADVVAGGDVSVQAEPGAPGVTIDGVDLRLKASPGDADVLSVSSNAKTDDASLPQAVQKSLEQLQDAMEGLLEAARSLEAHQGFINTAEGATGVRHDLDADGARLMALQVRQGLDAYGAGAIANVEPQAVLALFRE